MSNVNPNLSSAAALFFSGIVPKTELRIPTIQKDCRFLQSHGATREEALCIMLSEVSDLDDYGIVQVTDSMAPALVERFGLDYVAEATSFAYLYMDQFKLDSDEYLRVLDILLKDFQPELIATSPDIVRVFLNRLELEKGKDGAEEKTPQELEDAVIEKLKELY